MSRKRTPGRKIIHVDNSRVIAYVLKVKHGSKGYKAHERFREVVEVKYEKGKPDQYSNNVIKAHTKALDLASKKEFECIVIPRYIKTSYSFNRTRYSR